MKKIKVRLLNENGSIRWDIEIIQKAESQYEVNEDVERSLFSNPLCKGRSFGEALNRFMKIEAKLIEGL